MTRYILIDNNSGYVWGEADADNAFEACRKVDADLTPALRRYSRLDTDPLDDSNFYIVYDATGSDMVLNEGTDPATIAAVEALPIAEYVRFKDEEDTP